MVDPPDYHVLFSVLVDASFLLDGVLGNTEDGTHGEFHLGDVLTFLRIILRFTFFRLGFTVVVSALVSFRREMMYTLALLSVGASGEASSLADLIAVDVSSQPVSPRRQLWTCLYFSACFPALL